MSIKIVKIIYPSDSDYTKNDFAEIDFKGKDHLVYGPTDTGKTYIVESIKFALGGKRKYLRNIGYSDKYTRIGLHILVGDDSYTIFRDIIGKRYHLYSGHVSDISKTGRLKQTVKNFINDSLNIDNQKILSKAGVLSDLTISDLRRVSLFVENDTLSQYSFEGQDSNSYVRNRAAVSFILSGIDDKELPLVTSTLDKNLAQGKIDLINEQIISLENEIPLDIINSNVESILSEVEFKIEQILGKNKENDFKSKENRRLFLVELNKNKKSEREKEYYEESKINFNLLIDKLENDKFRLESLTLFNRLTSCFEKSHCPLCDSDLVNNENVLELSLAAEKEIDKINYHVREVVESISHIDECLSVINSDLKINNGYINQLERDFSKLISDFNNDDIISLIDEKSDLVCWKYKCSQYNDLKSILPEIKEKTVTQKQEVSRDLHSVGNELVKKIKELLHCWGVEDVLEVSFNSSNVDVNINGRDRISYGKGKRGLFLSAYVIALMELSIEKNHPHLGFVVIDSPVVTYKDPKHSKNAESHDDLLDTTVKDKFYSWLFKQEGAGQIIILENEEPQEKWKDLPLCTEFVGPKSKDGRKGLFPIQLDLKNK